MKEFTLIVLISDGSRWAKDLRSSNDMPVMGDLVQLSSIDPNTFAEVTSRTFVGQCMYPEARAPKNLTQEHLEAFGYTKIDSKY